MTRDIILVHLIMVGPRSMALDDGYSSGVSRCSIPDDTDLDMHTTDVDVHMGSIVGTTYGLHDSIPGADIEHILACIGFKGRNGKIGTWFC